MSDSYKIYASQDYVDNKGLPDGHGAYQQLVTDAEGVVKWEEKLAYVRTSIQTALNEKTVYTEAYDGYYSCSVRTPFAFESGKAYIINFDGTEYNCTASIYNETPYVGNIAIMGLENDTGEPFFIKNAYRALKVYTPSEGGHTFSISSSVTTIKQIDEQYIPDIPAEKLPTKHVISIAPDNSCSVSFTDAYNMVYAGSASFGIGILGGRSYIQTSYTTNNQNISGTIQNAIIADIIKISDDLSALQIAKLIWGESSGISVTTKQIPFQ